MKSWILDIKKHERKVFSQRGQDGVIEYLVDQVGTQNTPPYYVEFGMDGRDHSDGCGSNTANLALNCDWHGLLLDGKNENLDINLHKEFVISKNIRSIFEKYNVPLEPDYVSIDIDSCDLWVFKTILGTYSPRIISVEYNPNFPIRMAITFPDNPNETWQGDKIYGASLKALNMVANDFGYDLVHVVKYTDAFFVRNDLLSETKKPTLESFATKCSLPLHAPCTSGREKLLIDYEVYVHSDGNLDLASESAKKSYQYVCKNWKRDLYVLPRRIFHKTTNFLSKHMRF